jgi:hypothetical protein
MPDFLDPRDHGGAPRNWGEAFAAMPLDTPAADVWARVSRKLDAPALRGSATRRERRMSWLIGTASAAVLAMAAWSPLSRWLQDDDVPAPQIVAGPREAPGLRGPAAPVRSEPEPTQATPAGTGPVRSAGDAAAVATSKPAGTKPSRAQRDMRKHVATADPAPSDAATPGTVASQVADTAVLPADPLQDLKIHSAQLEALVALARDDRVSSGSRELLSAELDAGIATVDAALSQSDLTDARRLELWQQRVDLLQQLAGMEATSRWLAAQGATGTSLVSVH